MNIADPLAESYIQQFWSEKPEPMKQMIRMAFTAGFYGFRGQVAAMAMRGLLSNRFYGSIPTSSSTIPEASVKLADELITQLNKTK